MKVPIIRINEDEYIASVINYNFSSSKDEKHFIDASFDKNGEIEYVRVGGCKECEYVDAYDVHEYIRNYVSWGNSFNEKGERIPTKYVLLKNLGTEHIQAILEGGFGGKRIRHYLENELKWRNII